MANYCKDYLPKRCKLYVSHQAEDNNNLVMNQLSAVHSGYCFFPDSEENVCIYRILQSYQALGREVLNTCCISFIPKLIFYELLFHFKTFMRRSHLARAGTENFNKQ